jgi:hypothetical protein
MIGAAAVNHGVAVAPKVFWEVSNGVTTIVRLEFQKTYPLRTSFTSVSDLFDFRALVGAPGMRKGGETK